MKALIKHKKSLNRVLCCVLSFTLAFYTLCTPAFAEELAEAVQPPVQTEETTLVDTTELDEPTAPVEDEAPSEIATAAEESEVVVDENETDSASEEIEPFHTVSIDSSYDINTCTVTFTVTVKNESDAAINGLNFYSLNAVETITNENTDEFDGNEPFEFDHPADFDLAPREVKTFTLTHELILRPQTGQKVNVELFAIVATLADGLVDLAADGAGSIACDIPFASYEVDAYAMAVDEFDNIRGEEELLLPGDAVFFIYNVLNNGTLPLDVSAALEEGVAIATDAADSWGSTITLQPGEYCSFIALSEVDESMVGTTIDATSNLIIGDDEKRCELSSPEVADSYYQYVVYFGVRDAQGGGEILPKAQINKKQTAAEFYWPVDSVKANCPDLDAYVPTYYDANHNLIDVDSIEYITLSDDPAQNEFFVVYEPIVEQAEYTVYYYKDSTAGAVISSETRSGAIGAEIPLDIEGNCPEGYSVAATVIGSTVIGSDSAQNVVEVIYVKDFFGYTINYYTKDYAGNITYKTSIAGEKSVFGSTVMLTDAQLNAELDQGYEAIAESPDYSLTITADASANVIDVVYEPAAYSCTINYFKKDHTGEVTYLGSAMTGEEALFGSTVTFTDEQLNANRPTGFKKVVPGPEYQLVISADRNENAITVTYEPDTFSYTIRYYRDNSIDDTVHILDQVTGEGVYGSTVHVDLSLLNAHVPEKGFASKGPADEFDIVITEDAASNSYSVVYDRLNYKYTINYYEGLASEGKLIESVEGTYAYGYERFLTIDEINAFLPSGYKRIVDTKYISVTDDEDLNSIDIEYVELVGGIGYTINYYKDSISDENFITSESGFGTYGESIPYVEGAHAPAGYNPVGVVIGEKTIGLEASDNVMNVIYSKDQVAYTVNYYKDSISDENFLGKDEGSALLGSKINFEAGKYVPTGYDADIYYVSGNDDAIVANPSNNVLNIVYTTQIPLTWRVNYYYGDMTGDPETVRGAGVYGDAIPLDLNAHLKDGYILPSQVPSNPTVTNLEGETVVNIVYPIGTYGYTVNYYKDSVSDGNLLGTDTSSGLYNSPISFEQGKYAPVGYKTVGATSGRNYVLHDAQNNVLNVVYAVDSYVYTVNYYMGSVNPDNMIASVSDPQDARPFGSTVELRTAQMNMYRPNGFAEQTNARNLTIGADPASNVINVVFMPDFNVFYASGIDPLIVTYDGEKHYLTAQGVQDGDIVTYMFNGSYETRRAGVDENIGVEFQDVTDGAVDIAVTITRAGITSNAVQTRVNITPAVLQDPIDPENPIVPADPGMTDDPNAATSNPVLDASASIMEQIADRIVSYVDPGIDVPASTVANGLDTAVSNDLGSEETIFDEATPLAASPFAPLKSFPLISYLLVILATLCLVASSILLLVRARISNRLTRPGSELAVLNQSRVSLLTRLVIALIPSACVLYALWLCLIL